MTFGKSNGSWSVDVTVQCACARLYRIADGRAKLQTGKDRGPCTNEASGSPQKVAYLVGFLTSEKADYISGQVIGLNGGMA